MLHTNFLNRLAQAADVKLFFIVILIGSFVLNLGLGWTIATWPKTQRTIYLPPEVSKSFWIDSEKVAPEYVEMMGTYALQLVLNVTPQSVKYQGNMLLAITDPRAHPAIKQRIERTAARLSRDGVSTIFSPEAVYTDPKKPMRIAWSGNLVTLLTDKRVNEVRKFYMVEFETVAGRTVLSRFEETTEAAPLAPAVTISAQEKNQD